jgi:D-aminoacyl-tRNA deacylase
LTFLIVASKVDLAALNIAEKLINKFKFKETDQNFEGEPIYKRDNVLLTFIKGESIRAGNLDNFFNVEGIVFASRHKSESEEPTLTVHAPGNLGADASFGGRPKELALAWPQRMKIALRRLFEAKDKLSTEYRISLEATHHGPTELKIPVWFVEIGSSEKYWVDIEVGEVVAEAIWASVTEEAIGSGAVGFGGGHYSPRHTSFCLEEKKVAVGHIIPKYMIDSVDSEIISLAFKRSVGHCATAIIDWKGLRGDQRSNLLKILKDLRIEVVKA